MGDCAGLHSSKVQSFPRSSFSLPLLAAPLSSSTSQAIVQALSVRRERAFVISGKVSQTRLVFRINA